MGQEMVGGTAPVGTSAPATDATAAAGQKQGAGFYSALVRLMEELEGKKQVSREQQRSGELAGQGEQTRCMPGSRYSRWVGG